MDTAIIYIDGASRGNPGPAAYAFVILYPDGRYVQDFRSIGHTTNNVAEYTALLRAFECAAGLGLKKLLVRSDSELLVKQMRGDYQVRSPVLGRLFLQADDLRARFDAVEFQHILRAMNAYADSLANIALQ